MTSIYQNLEKLKENVLEYQNYLEFLPLITSFKEKYENGMDLVKEAKNILVSNDELNGVMKNNRKNKFSILLCMIKIQKN